MPPIDWIKIPIAPLVETEPVFVTEILPPVPPASPEPLPPPAHVAPVPPFPPMPPKLWEKMP